MVRFATTDDHKWIFDAVSAALPVRPENVTGSLEHQIANKGVIADDDLSVASFVVHDEYVEVLFNVFNPKRSDQWTSSPVLSTYLIYRYERPLRFLIHKDNVERYFATKGEYVNAHTALLGTKEIEGEVYNYYEYTHGGL